MKHNFDQGAGIPLLFTCRDCGFLTTKPGLYKEQDCSADIVDAIALTFGRKEKDNPSVDEWTRRFTEEHCPKFERPVILGVDPAKPGSERTVFRDGTVIRHKEDGTTEVERGPFKPAEPGEEVQFHGDDGSTLVHTSTRRGVNDWLTERRKKLCNEMVNWLEYEWVDPAPGYELDEYGNVKLDHKGNPVPRRERK